MIINYKINILQTKTLFDFIQSVEKLMNHGLQLLTGFSPPGLPDNTFSSVVPVAGARTPQLVRELSMQQQ